MLEKVNIEAVRKTTEKYNKELGGLITTLEAVQSEYGYLPEEALRTIADTNGHSLVDVCSVATFYSSFSLQPRGKHLIRVCLGTACHVRGAAGIADEFQRQLGIKSGETTSDRNFTLETVNCLGACALGPVVVIDGICFSKVTKSRVKSLAEAALRGFDRTDVGEDERVFPIDVSCPHCSRSLMDRSFTIDDAPSIRITATVDHKDGSLRLSSLYGSYNFFSEHDIPTGTVVRCSCPHCHLELIGSWECPTCSAPMASMAVRGGGMLQVCLRRGCKGHMLDVGRGCKGHMLDVV